MVFRLLAILLFATLLTACAEQEEAPKESPRRRPPRLIREAPPIETIAADAPRSPLVASLQSMMSLEETIAALPDDQPFEVAHNRHTEKRGACPGQHFLELVVTRFWDLERKGTLHLQFYDDRLTQAWFKTFDVEGYRTAFFELHQLERENRWKPVYILPGSVVKNPVSGNEAMLIEDFRLRKWSDSVEKACRHQLQKERGLLDEDPDSVAEEGS